MRDELLRRAGRSKWAQLRQAAAALFPDACFEALLEQQQGFGPFCTLSFDCDFPRDVEALPQICALLEHYQYTASFACIGQWVRRFPQEHRLLAGAGYELLNHTDTHPNLYHPDYDYARAPELSRRRFNQLAPDERRQELERGHAAFVEVLDYTPVGFRTPHFGELHVEDVYALLAGLSYRFSSSVLASAAPSGGTPFRVPAGIWEFPVSPCPAHPFGVFDTWHSLGKRGGAHARPGELTSLFIRLCERVQGRGGYVNVYLDPRDALDSGELRRMLDYLRSCTLAVVDYATLLEKMEADPTSALIART